MAGSRDHSPVIAPERLRYGIAASLLGRAASTLVGILLVPFYLRVLGVEAIGLIGLYTTSLGVFLIIDHVLGTFAARETARLSHAVGSSDRRRDLLATSETAYLLLGIVIGLFITAAAPNIPSAWITATTLERSTVLTCLVLAAWTIPLQLLFNLHINILTGLERQIEANILLAAFGVGRGILAVLAILVIGEVTEVYFAAQLAAIVISLAFAIAIAWRRMPQGSRRPSVRFEILAQSWRFNSLLMANAIVFVATSQGDKIVVSSLLPLSTFGYYALAGTITSLPALAVTPIMSVLLPKFSRLLGSHSEPDVAGLFHLASQLVSVALVPVWTVTVFFPDAIVTVWTGDPTSGNELSLILPLLMSGAVLLSLNCVPNALAFAAGWPQFPLIANVVAMLALPLGYLLTEKYGAAGATVIWLIFGLLNVVVVPVLMHRRILIGELGRWYFVDIALPLLAASSVTYAAYLVLPMTATRIGLFVEIAVVWILGSLASVIAAPGLRAESLRFVRYSYAWVTRG